MEESLTYDRRAIYIRVSAVPDNNEDREDSNLHGLFTRPPILAIRGENPKGRPARALNRACRMLLQSPESSDESASRIADISDTCGFIDTSEFIHLFRHATGWTPEDWMKEFGHVQ